MCMRVVMVVVCMRMNAIDPSIQMYVSHCFVIASNLSSLFVSGESRALSTGLSSLQWRHLQQFANGNPHNSCLNLSPSRVRLGHMTMCAFFSGWSSCFPLQAGLCCWRWPIGCGRKKLAARHKHLCILV